MLHLLVLQELINIHCYCTTGIDALSLSDKTKNSTIFLETFFFWVSNLLVSHMLLYLFTTCKTSDIHAVNDANDFEM